MTTLTDACALLVTLALAGICLHGLYRAVRPSRMPAEIEAPKAWIDPDVAAERLISTLTRGPSRIQAAMDVGGIPVSVRWVVDLTMPRYGLWWIRVGDHAGHAADLSVVYQIVRSRLAAIARERGQQASHLETP